MSDGDLPFSAACERNKGPILEVLRGLFADRRRILEIGSGTGQHAVHFASNLAQVVWQCTDRGEWLPGLRARLTREGTANLPAPLELDVSKGPWPVGPFDAVYSANTLHIMSWADVEAMFAGLRSVLAADAVLAIYGPFNRDGRFTAPSNAAFDADLRRRDPLSGIRDRDDIQALAQPLGLGPYVAHALPANNELLVWRRATQ